MRAYISIFRNGASTDASPSPFTGEESHPCDLRGKVRGNAATCLALLIGVAALLAPALARASDAAGGASGTGKTFQPEEDDFTGSPFTEYGEFNEDKDEEEDAKYFQHGRFFGVSGGLGFQGISGNRGLLYQGGFPLVDLKLHYWFDFNFALDLGFSFVSHFFEGGDANGGHTDVNMFHVYADAKYYFDTKNLSAPISFANPFLLIGVGSFTQTKTSVTEDTQEPDTGIGLSFGAGLEFAIRPKKTYLEFEGKYHMVTFKDTFTTLFRPAIQDLTGGFFTFQANILFVW